MFNPALASQQIKDEFVDYIVTTRYFADPILRKSFEKELSRIISKGPYVDIKDVFEPSLSIQELINSGELSPLFREIEAGKTPLYDPTDRRKRYHHKLPLSRPLYMHQVNAIRQVSAGKNTVITTGTGSGKTECFMIPILNALLQEKQEGTLSKEGIRIILVYPMNALANDQMKRLREILMFYENIIFAIYTGDTKHKTSEADQLYREMHQHEKHDELTTPLPNEHISRDDIKNHPPHILCTNYAMLEHLLFRPDDDQIFSSADLRFVVLDEAHIYSGATGMETAFLLRRLKARVKHTSRPVQFILTSATLGDEGKSEADIIKFAQNLCGERFEASGIVFGRRRKWKAPSSSRDVPIEFFSQLTKHDELSAEWVRDTYQLFGFVYNENTDYQENLYNLCSMCSLYIELRKILSGPQSIDWYALKLNVSKDEFIALIHICSQARKEECSLIDARYHFFIRALEGAYLAFDGENNVKLERKTHIYQGDKEYEVFEIAQCTHCGHIAIVGDGRKDKLIQSPRFAQDIQFFGIKEKNVSIDSQNEEDLDESPENEAEEEIEPVETQHAEKLSVYSLCVQCGDLQVIEEEDDDVAACSCPKSKRILVVKRDNESNRCIHCNIGRYKGLYLGNEAATAVLATSLFERLPIKQRLINIGDEDVEVDAGKQFLSFSDSRSEAAYFASYMKRSYREFLRRRGIWQCIHMIDDDEKYVLADLVEDLSNKFCKNYTFEEQIGGDQKLSRREKVTLAQRHAWMAVLSELINSQRAESLTSLGYLQYRYSGNTKRVVQYYAQRYLNGKEVLCKTLLDELVMTMAYAGAILHQEVMTDEDNKYIFFTTAQIGFVMNPDGTQRTNCKGWIPRSKQNSMSYVMNKRLQLVLRAFAACSLDRNEERAIDFLTEYWEEWLIDVRANTFPLKLQRNRYCLEPESFQIVLPNDPSAHWYKCHVCGRITSYNIDGKCNMPHCFGIIDEIDIEKEYAKNHYKRLYEQEWIHSLLMLEHTAQLSRKTAQGYQQRFEKNEIHALSCSTTFEMGVDVGELETVFLRNIPPSASNYTQRAGRAGRSENAAAYAITYARLSSHDFHYFDHHDQMIEGSIRPPMFKDNNEKVVMRHVYAVVLAYFLRTNPAGYYNGDKAQRFLEEGGIEALKDMLINPPKELAKLLELSFGLSDAGKKSINEQFQISHFGWIEKLVGKRGILSLRVAEYEETVAEFGQIIQGILKKLQSEQLSSQERLSLSSRQIQLERRLSLHRSQGLIDFLVRGNILPKYGFPVDTVELFRNIEQTRDSSNELSLQRDLHMAISEYAPGADIVANDEMYTSRYIKRTANVDTAMFEYSYIHKCHNCDTWNHVLVIPEGLIQCTGCGAVIDEWEEAISPRQGMVAEKEVKPVPMTRPERQFRSDDCYIGEGKTLQTVVVNCNSRQMTLTSSENDQIMTVSNDWYYVCKKCGFAMNKSETPYFIPASRKQKKDGPITRTAFKRSARAGVKEISNLDEESAHENVHGTRCHSTVLHKERLNHLFMTDVVQLSFDVSFADVSQALSVMYGLLNAISTSMDIDRDDISGCIKCENHELRIMLFDVTAGGSGHVRQLLESNGKTMKDIICVAYQNLVSCFQNCDTSCYSCLRSYQNQRQHDLLNRKSAIKFLEYYIVV
jgi:Distinct helicase family with a unique C-terminal domain including a metal-binding cysteine cluster